MGNVNLLPVKHTRTGCQKPLSLLDLPDPCLLAVLQCCDQRSLFSAARAHSRLHQAAALAQTSITLGPVKQHQADAVLLYLARHGQHVSSIDLSAGFHNAVTLRQLAPNLQLHSLELSGFYLQLQPGGGCMGVLGPAAGLSAIKQLRLEDCLLLDCSGNRGLVAALQRLGPGLQHLSLRGVQLADSRDRNAPEDTDQGDGSSLDEAASDVVSLTPNVLQRMQQLTHLELFGVSLLLGPGQPEEDALQPLQALTRLAGLRLNLYNEDVTVSASLLSGMCHLTRLELSRHRFEPAVLDGRTQLQHLVLCDCSGLQDEGDWGEQLLSRLQPLQQLTHLSLPYSLTATPSTPAAAYSALTASSRLQHLYIRGATLPVGAWAHVFPTDRQLLQLTSLSMVAVKHPPPGGDAAVWAALESSRLASCCPGLQRLEVHVLQCSAGEIAALQGLTGLHTLVVRDNGEHEEPTPQQEEVLCEAAQLTQLQQLTLAAASERLLSQLTTLVHLTQLEFGIWSTDSFAIYHHMTTEQLVAKGPDDEPVWRQLLRHLAAPPPSPFDDWFADT